MAENYDAETAFITALAKLLTEHDLTEIEVERSFGEDVELEVKLTRQGAQPVYAAPAAAPAPPPAPHAAPAAPAQPAAAAEAPADPAQHPGAVTSPMVGTVYLQAEPGAPAFVAVGDQVSEGQTLLIIEAMKTMNQIPAPMGGKVARILVGDGEPVEFGAPLVVIE